jgi:hypothetical protein
MEGGEPIIYEYVFTKQAMMEPRLLETLQGALEFRNGRSCTYTLIQAGVVLFTIELIGCSFDSVLSFSPIKPRMPVLKDVKQKTKRSEKPSRIVTGGNIIKDTHMVV